MREEGNDLFATTHWTVVMTAGAGNADGVRAALAELCRTYWYPLYVYARRRGHGPEDAEDLTQGFFARLLRLDSLAGLSRERGRFRAFLLASMNHYMADEWQKSRSRKRDVQLTISLDRELAEKRYGCEPVDHLTPEVLFQRQWALTLLEKVLQLLRDEYVASGKGDLFMQLRETITGDKIPYRLHAEKLGMEEGAVRVAAHRLRSRYRELLRHQIAQTVGVESDVETELNELRRILSA